MVLTSSSLLLLRLIASAHPTDDATFSALPQDWPTVVVVKVNGRQVFPAAGKSVRVQVNARALGRIEVSHSRSKDTEPQPPSVVWAQFTPGTEYVVRENPCSMFELWPKGQDEETPPVHWVSFRVAPGVRQAIEFRTSPGPTVLVKPGTTSAPSPVYPGGAMCMRAAATFEALPEHGDRDTVRTKRISYRFLNDQLLVVTYSGPRAELSLSLREKPAGLVAPGEVEGADDVSPEQ